MHLNDQLKFSAVICLIALRAFQNDYLKLKRVFFRDTQIMTPAF